MMEQLSEERIMQSTQTLVLVQSLGELVDGRRDLDTLLEDGTLSLDTDIARPLDVATQVTFLGENIATDTEVSGVLREEVSV